MTRLFETAENRKVEDQIAVPDLYTSRLLTELPAYGIIASRRAEKIMLLIFLIYALLRRVYGIHEQKLLLAKGQGYSTMKVVLPE